MGKPQRQLRLVQATCLLVLGACIVLAYWRAHENRGTSSSVGFGQGDHNPACALVGCFGVHHPTQTAASHSSKLLQIDAIYPMAGGAHFSALECDRCRNLGASLIRFSRPDVDCGCAFRSCDPALADLEAGYCANTGRSYARSMSVNA